jgi:hypothetical protein
VRAGGQGDSLPNGCSVLSLDNVLTSIRRFSEKTCKVKFQQTSVQISLSTYPHPFSPTFNQKPKPSLTSSQRPAETKAQPCSRTSQGLAVGETGAEAQAH